MLILGPWRRGESVKGWEAWLVIGLTVNGSLLAGTNGWLRNDDPPIPRIGGGGPKLPLGCGGIDRVSNLAGNAGLEGKGCPGKGGIL